MTLNVKTLKTLYVKITQKKKKKKSHEAKGKLNIMIVKGLNAIEKLNETKESTKNALRYLKAGDSVVVSVPSTEEVAQVYTHGVFGVFNSCQCTKEDLFDQAVDYLYSQANVETNEDKKKELKDKAYQLKAKPRFLFGFYDLETGEPLLIDASKKQGQSLFSIISEYKEELGSYAFKLSKADGGVLSLTPILKGLTATQKENFEKTKGVELDGTLYEKAIFKRDTNGQIEDLKKFGFDVSLIIDTPQAETNGEDLPF